MQSDAVFSSCSVIRPASRAANEVPGVDNRHRASAQRRLADRPLAGHPGWPRCLRFRPLFRRFRGCSSLSPRLRGPHQCARLCLEARPQPTRRAGPKVPTRHRTFGRSTRQPRTPAETADRPGHHDNPRRLTPCESRRRGSSEGPGHHPDEHRGRHGHRQAQGHHRRTLRRGQRRPTCGTTRRTRRRSPASCPTPRPSSSASRSSGSGWTT